LIASSTTLWVSCCPSAHYQPDSSCYKSNTPLAVDFYKLLGDTFLTHVRMASMPLINSIKDLLPRYSNSPSKMLPVLAQLMSPQNNARFFMGHLNPLKRVFASYFCSIAMFPAKLLQPISLSARIHVSKLDAHLPMHQNIHDLVNLTLQNARFNRCSGSTLGCFLPIIG
jgi:hypothetical protein